ncbi:MAG: peptide ABC transporter substrate-binding protein [Herpetosiphon sp.]
MTRPLRWQISLAIVGIAAIAGLVGLAALRAAAHTLPVSGGAYVEGVVGVATDLNPLVFNGSASQANRDLVGLLFDGLTQPGADGLPEAALAARWEIDASGTVYTFTLRSGLRWHDGVPVTTADVVFTVASIKDPLFTPPGTVADVWRTVQAEALDRQRVRFTLAAPFAPFLAATNLPIVPAHLLGTMKPADWAGSSFAHAPVGTGPFRLERLSPQEAVLRPFEGAVRGRPATDLLILRFFGSQNEANEALRRHDIQGLALVAQPGDRLPFLRHPTRVSAAGLDRYTIVTFNTHDPLLQERTLRQALVQMIDRDALLALLPPNGGRRLETPVLPGTWAATQEAALPRQDGAAAARLLEEQGWHRESGTWQRGDQRLALALLVTNNGPQRALGNALARQWREGGVAVQVQPMAAAELKRQLSQHTFSLALQEWGDVGSDPDLYALWHSSQIAAGENYAGVADAALDRLLEQGRTTTAAAARRQIYGAMQRRWIALVPSLPLFQSQIVYLQYPEITPLGFAEHMVFGMADRLHGVSRWLTHGAQ